MEVKTTTIQPIKIKTSSQLAGLLDHLQKANDALTLWML